MEALHVGGATATGRTPNAFSLATSPPPGLDAATRAAEEFLGSPDTMAEAVKEAIYGDIGQKVAEMQEANAQVGTLGKPDEDASLAVREAVLHIVDQKVSEQAEELWKKGKQALAQIQAKQKENQLRLTDQVKQCRERQMNLEADNDKLKQALTGLASRFALLGAAFQAPPGPLPMQAPTPAGVPPLTPQPPGASPSPSQVSASPSLSAKAEGAVLFDSGSTGLGLGAKLPEVPSFPLLGSPTPASAQPLSLAEGLGLGRQQPQKTPLSLATSLTPSRSPEAGAGVAPPLSPYPLGSMTPTASAGPAGSFAFTLRKADGADLGLDVLALEQDKALLVRDVVSDGAVEAWNKQCAQNSIQAQEKMVHAGDKIVSVNSVSNDPLKMLEECRDKQLLRLCLVRGDRCATDCGAVGAATTPTGSASTGVSGASVMRAEAAAFVPRGELGVANQQGAAVEESTPSNSNADASVHRV